MDLRAPLSPDTQKKVVRRLNRIPFIKGAYLARVDLLTYKPAGSASNTSAPTYEVKDISLPMANSAGSERMHGSHITFALAFPDSWHRGS